MIVTEESRIYFLLLQRVHGFTCRYILASIVCVSIHICTVHTWAPPISVQSFKYIPDARRGWPSLDLHCAKYFIRCSSTWLKAAPLLCLFAVLCPFKPDFYYIVRDTFFRQVVPVYIDMLFTILTQCSYICKCKCGGLRRS